MSATQANEPLVDLNKLKDCIVDLIQVIGDNKEKITPELVILIIQRAANLSTEERCRATKSPIIVRTRQIIAYLLRTIFSMRYSDIQKYSHIAISTINHSINTVSKAILCGDENYLSVFSTVLEEIFAQIGLENNQ